MPHRLLAAAALLGLGLLLALALATRGPDSGGLAPAPPTAVGPAADAPADPPDGAAVPPPVARPDAPSPPRSARAAPPAGASRPANPFVPPAAGAPLREYLGELQQAAQRGDASAACTLATEVVRCRAARLRAAQSADTLVAVATTQGFNERQLELRSTYLARRMEQQERDAVHCDGVDLATLPTPARLFMQAGDAGHRPSMIAALSPEYYDTATLFRDPELIPLLRARVVRYFQAALDAGDTALLSAWRRASWAQGEDVLGQALPPAWREPGFFVALHERVLAARGVPPVDSALRGAVPTPTQRDEARRVFDRYFATALRGRTGSPDVAAARGAPHPSSLRARCSEPPAA